MKKSLALLTILPFLTSLSQTSFSFEDYQSFVHANSNLSSTQLLEMNSAGEFKRSVESSWSDALYSDSIEIKLNITDGEKSLILKNGFVVSERLGQNSFISTVEEIYNKDLPLFVTTDMILHGFHRSYDEILKTVELQFLIPRLQEYLEKLIAEIPNIENKYQSDYMKARLKDVDLYLSVPLKILDKQATPNYVENVGGVDYFIERVEEEAFAEIPFFSETPRKIDFSQFKPRGHYDNLLYPKLKKYFRAMIWLGKIELYLIAPDAYVKPTLAEVKRQTIIANIILELMESGNLQQNFDEIERVIEAFVGEQDNVTFSNLNSLKGKMGFLLSSELVDTSYFKLYQNYLAEQSYAPQRILSQVLMNNPASEDEIKPASSFLMFGQRFVIDSYITGSVVYNKVKKKRMLPSTLDILFAVGNDAAAQLLVKELDEYQYSPNLAGVNYLVDAYDDEFWNSTIYNGWLNSIRKLNPPAERELYPEFMQTAAWWQQKMNTQLGSWTELRHDNLLYAKQSYSSGVTCSYPYSYVEPFPKFYSALKEMALNFKNKMSEFNLNNEYMDSYFNNFYEVNDTLEIIAQKELNGTPFTDSEIIFLKGVLTNPQGICGGVVYDGWYPKLFYGKLGEDFLVADYHTAPTDASGAMVGWVAHAGTGKIDLAIMNTQLPSGENVAFVGPVYGYHEYTSTNFFRLTDEEWTETYLNLSTRPEWTQIYLADINGNKQASSLSLITDVAEQSNNSTILETHIIAQNYPNPFNPSTIISFSVPSNLTNKKVKLTVFNVKGEEVKTLINETLQSGNYLAEWNGVDSKNSRVTSGIYFYEIRIADKKYVGKMNLIK